MDASNVWELFEKTGNIGVYLLYKKLSQENKEEKKEDFVNYADSDRRDCN